MLLVVRAGRSELLADVGFGGDGLIEPLPMDGDAHDQFGDAYRVVEEGAERILQWRGADCWTDLYRFVPEPRPPVDFEVANHYTSTHPDSRFVRTLTAQLSSPTARHVLRNLTYSVRRGSRIEEQAVASSEVPRLLRERFGIEVPDGARFRALLEAPG
jgi:N-hydroxyarylamine O-acetyltransferase